jgi:hypothetical protein
MFSGSLSLKIISSPPRLWGSSCSNRWPPQAHSMRSNALSNGSRGQVLVRSSVTGNWIVVDGVEMREASNETNSLPVSFVMLILASNRAFPNLASYISDIPLRPPSYTDHSLHINSTL